MAQHFSPAALEATEQCGNSEGKTSGGENSIPNQTVMSEEMHMILFKQANYQCFAQ